MENLAIKNQDGLDLILEKMVRFMAAKKDEPVNIDLLNRLFILPTVCFCKSVVSNTLKTVDLILAVRPALYCSVLDNIQNLLYTTKRSRVGIYKKSDG